MNLGFCVEIQNLVDLDCKFEFSHTAALFWQSMLAPNQYIIIVHLHFIKCGLNELLIHNYQLIGSIFIHACGLNELLIHKLSVLH